MWVSIIWDIYNISNKVISNNASANVKEIFWSAKIKVWVWL